MKFIKEYGLYILIVIAVFAFVIVALIPLCVGIARDMWQWALYGII